MLSQAINRQGAKAQRGEAQRRHLPRPGVGGKHGGGFLEEMTQKGASSRMCTKSDRQERRGMEYGQEWPRQQPRAAEDTVC